MATSFTTVGSHIYNIPAGYNTFDIECWGTNGDNSSTIIGVGGYIKGRFSGLTTSLTVDIGGQGDVSFYHGGLGSRRGGAGAGVRIGISADPLIVAGGGAGFAVGGGPGGSGGAMVGEDGDAAGSGGTQVAGGLANGSYKIGGAGQSNTVPGQNGSGGGGGYYGGGGGAGATLAGGGGSNGYTLPPGVSLIGAITTLRGGNVNIPAKPLAGTIGAVRITPVCFLALYTGSLADYTVPEGTQCLQVQLWGANGGGSQTLPSPIPGGYCEAQIAVTPGDVLDLSVGSAGQPNLAGVSPGGYLTGGAPNPLSTTAGGGGGAGTGIAFASAIIIAAGGGGGSSGCFATPPFNYFLGGNGGGLVGSDGAGAPLSGQGGQIGAGGNGGIGNSSLGSSGLGGIGGAGASGAGNCGTGGGGGGFTGGGGGGVSDINTLPIIGSGGGGSSNYDPASPLPITFFNTIPDIMAPANLDVNGNGVICIVPGACVCVAKGTMISTVCGEIPIERLQSGDIVQSYDGQVEVVKLVALNRTIPWQLIECNSSLLGNDTGSRLLITPTHPMLIEGREVTGQELLKNYTQGVKLIRNTERIPVYTLITEHKNYIQMNGFSVATWSEASWQNFIENDSTGRII